MQKIIFIEPINVLNSQDHISKLMKMNGGRYSEMMEEDMQGDKIKLLKELMDETGAEIVLCSEWRTCPIKMQGVLENLQKQGISPDNGIHSFMSFGERGITKTESMNRHKNLIRNKNRDTKIVAIDSKLNKGCMEGDGVFYTLQESQGMTVDLKDYVASCLGKVVDK